MNNNKESKNLEGKTAIILGATGGIGAATAMVLAGAGANLVLASRNTTRLSSLQTDLSTVGMGEKVVTQTDASDIQAVENLINRSKEQFGAIDLIFVAVGTYQRVDENTFLPEAVSIYETLEKTILRPMYNLALVMLKQPKSFRPWVVHVSSHVVSNYELSGNLAYGALKAGASNIVAQLYHQGFRCSDLRPGFVDTPGNSGVLDTPEKRSKVVQKDEIGNWIIEHFDDPLSMEIKMFESRYKLE